jgi:hypothetical protein
MRTTEFGLTRVPPRRDWLSTTPSLPVVLVCVVFLTLKPALLSILIAEAFGCEARARRGLEVATAMWQLSPTSSNRQALAEATAARREAALREELCNDDMVSAAIRWVS